MADNRRAASEQRSGGGGGAGGGAAGGGGGRRDTARDVDESHGHLEVWYSPMARATQTSNAVEGPWCISKVEHRALREIDVGICDGMTYKEIEEKYPAEFEARKKDKLRYRYPRGESYLDLVARLEPIILEIERQATPVLVIAHQALLRCLYAYFAPGREIALEEVHALLR